MADEKANALVDLTDLAGLSTPANTLVKKVSAAVGGVFRPYQIRRVAKAEAEVALLRAQTEIQITDIHRRALHRFIAEEAQHQKNMEGIMGKAIPLLDERADATRVSDDWVTNFFDKSRIISEPQMQDIWARVLAGEVNAPGSYSRRTVNILGDLDAADARLFTSLCGFVGRYLSAHGDYLPLIFGVEDQIYVERGINFSNLKHLDSIGLLQFESLTGYVIADCPERFEVFYYERPLTLEMPAASSRRLEVGHVLLTRIGRELVSICGSNPVPGFVDYIKEKWKAHLPKLDTQQAPPPSPPRGSPETTVELDGR